MTVYISQSLMDEYADRYAYATVAGVIRQAYSESASTGNRVLKQLLTSISRLPAERREGWKLFVQGTVPRLRGDIEEGKRTVASLSVVEEQRKLNAARGRGRKR